MNNKVGHYKVGRLVEQMERYCQFRRQKKKRENFASVECAACLSSLAYSSRNILY